MSFILDALKKSENERQRYQGPSLVDTPARLARQERPWWAIGLAALLLLNLLVFAVVLLRDGNDAAKPPAPAQVSVTPTHVAPVRQPAPPRAQSAPPPIVDPPVASSPPPDLAVRSLAAEAGVPEHESETLPPEAQNPELATASEVPDGPPMVRPIEGPATAPARTAPNRREEVLPTLSDLTASGSAQLPPMHLDIHVYSPTPAERFVFINMRKYREGESMSEGPLIERIERDGVVMNHRGLRFQMPRQ